MTLDRDRVVALARVPAPSVATAAARVGEARALHVGARSLAPENPTVTLRAGPRFVAGSSDVRAVTDEPLSEPTPDRPEVTLLSKRFPSASNRGRRGS